MCQWEPGGTTWEQRGGSGGAAGAQRWSSGGTAGEQRGSSGGATAGTPCGHFYGTLIILLLEPFSGLAIRE